MRFSSLNSLMCFEQLVKDVDVKKNSALVESTFVRSTQPVCLR